MKTIIVITFFASNFQKILQIKIELGSILDKFIQRNRLFVTNFAYD